MEESLSVDKIYSLVKLLIENRRYAMEDIGQCKNVQEISTLFT